MTSARTPRLFLTLLLLISLPTIGWSLPAGPSTPLEALGFMSGTWTGQQGTTQIEEHWSIAQGQAMMGMFRLVSSGTPIFYEFMQIERKPDGIRLHIRHFGPGMTSWQNEQSTMVFQLQEYRPNSATFKRSEDDEKLTYTKHPGDELVIVLSQLQNGKPSESTFRFKRSRDKKPEPLPQPEPLPGAKKKNRRSGQ